MASPIIIDVKASANQDGKAYSQNANNIRKAQGLNDVSVVATSMYAVQLGRTLVDTSKTLIRHGINNYGNASGNYLMQNNINNSIETFNAINQIIQGGIGGFAVTGNVYGAVIGATISLVGLGVNAYTSNKDYQMSILKSNQTAMFNSANFGVILTNGNR